MVSTQPVGYFHIGDQLPRFLSERRRLYTLLQLRFPNPAPLVQLFDVAALVRGVWDSRGISDFATWSVDRYLSLRWEFCLIAITRRLDSLGHLLCVNGEALARMFADSPPRA